MDVVVLLGEHNPVLQSILPFVCLTAQQWCILGCGYCRTLVGNCMLEIETHCSECHSTAGSGRNEMVMKLLPAPLQKVTQHVRLVPNV